MITVKPNKTWLMRYDTKEVTTMRYENSMFMR